MKHQGAIFREVLDRGTVVCPGAWNGLVAAAIAQTGFQTCYVSGGATANAAGYPDIGLISLSHMCRTIQEVAEAGKIPVVVDADTGFEESGGVAQTIVEYDRSGAAAMHIEDQVFPKRCGHLEGKTLVSKTEMVNTIRTAAECRLNEEFVLIARTDARGVNGLQAAIDRGCAYREAGADMIFPEGLHDEEEFATFAKECDGLLLANMTEFGKTPHIPIETFSAIGYDLVIYPITMQRVAMGAITRCLSQLHAEGSAEGFEDQMQTRKALYELLEYVPSEPWRPSQA